MSEHELRHTLILEVALPDFNCDDYIEDETLREVLREWFETSEPTPEQIAEAVLNDSGETAGGHVRLSILTGSKNGNELQRVDGFIIGSRVVPREANHEREKDERLDHHEREWIDWHDGLVSGAEDSQPGSDADA